MHWKSEQDVSETVQTASLFRWQNLSGIEEVVRVGASLNSLSCRQRAQHDLARLSQPGRRYHWSPGFDLWCRHGKSGLLECTYNMRLSDVGSTRQAVTMGTDTRDKQPSQGACMEHVMPLQLSCCRALQQGVPMGDDSLQGARKQGLHGCGIPRGSHESIHSVAQDVQHGLAGSVKHLQAPAA